MGRLISIAVVLTLFFSIPVSFAQKDTLEEFTYIRPYPEHFYFKIIPSFRSFSVNFEHIQNDLPPIQYTPGTSAYYGIGAYAFDLGLELSFRVSDNENNPNGTSVDWQAHMLGRKFGLDFAYLDFKGMILDNPNEFNNKIELDTSGIDPVREDIQVKSINLSFIYMFNPENFSFPAVFNHSEQQIRSSGSFLLTGYSNLSEVSGDSNLTTWYPSDGSISPKINNINSRIFAVMPGYAHTIVFMRNLYVSINLAMGLGIQNSSYDYAKLDNYEHFSDTRLNFAFNSRFATGYNSPTFFGGLTFFWNQYQENYQDVKLNTNSIMIKLFFGYRIREWGVLKKSIFDVFPFLQSKYGAGYGARIDR